MVWYLSLVRGRMPLRACCALTHAVARVRAHKHMHAYTQDPLDFSVHTLEWASNGRAILLLDRDAHCIAYLTTD